MADLLILSKNSTLADQWKIMLSIEHNICIAHNITDVIGSFRLKPADVLIIDADVLDSDTTALTQIKELDIKTLIIGRNWSEDKQIRVLVSGMSGYCEHEAALKLLLKAINSICKGDIWIQRHLVPKVIGQLVKLTHIQTTQAKKTIPINKNLQLLTHRELDVARMICAGESNKMIASLLNISERTVKAHLTSIFQKLDVQDRLHLAILLKEIIQ